MGRASNFDQPAQIPKMIREGGAEVNLVAPCWFVSGSTSRGERGAGEELSSGGPHWKRFDGSSEKI